MRYVPTETGMHDPGQGEQFRGCGGCQFKTGQQRCQVIVNFLLSEVSDLLLGAGIIDSAKTVVFFDVGNEFTQGNEASFRPFSGVAFFTLGFCTLFNRLISVGKTLVFDNRLYPLRGVWISIRFAMTDSGSICHLLVGGNRYYSSFYRHVTGKSLTCGVFFLQGWSEEGSAFRLDHPEGDF